MPISEHSLPSQFMLQSWVSWNGTVHFCCYSGQITNWPLLWPSHHKEMTAGLRFSLGTFLAVQWLTLHASNAGGTGFIPGWRTKIPRATLPKNKVRLSLARSRARAAIRKTLTTQWAGGNDSKVPSNSTVHWAAAFFFLLNVYSIYF